MTSKALIEPRKVNRLLGLECERVYPSLLEAVYKQNRPKSNLRDILEDDKWRFNELPKSLKPGDGLSKKQLARLVRWKITHGVYRPFLPGMIQKNSEGEVTEHTTNAAKTINDVSNLQARDSITKTIISALDQVCKLKGVGPATGTLVLSIFNPAVVPFFQDELFAWLIPEHAAKLKYDKKEYNALLSRALDIILDKGVEARLLEQTAYVLTHSELLAKDQRAQLQLSCENKTADDADRPSPPPPEHTAKVSEVEKSKREPPLQASKSQSARKRSPVEGNEPDKRRSKRRKT